MLCFDIANITDIEKVVSLVNSAYRGTNKVVGWTSEVNLVDGLRVNREQVSELIRSPGSVILLMKNGNQVQACVHLRRRGEVVYLGMLAVDPMLQGQGLGSQLLEYSEDYSRLAFSVSKIEMCVIAQRVELISFYERRGYLPYGTEEEYPRELNVGIPRSESLTIRELSKAI